MKGPVPEAIVLKVALDPGQLVKLISGWIESGCLTVTVNEHLFVFPDASVAVAVTVFVPTGKKEPDAGA